MSHIVPQPVLAALSSAHFAGNALTLAGQMDRAMYTKVAKVIELAGGKWNRKTQSHIFAGNAQDAVDLILLTGLINDIKRDYGQFYTPAEVAERVIEIADLCEGMTVLEPSAGRGALASLAALEGCVVDCIEVDQANVDHLRAAPFHGVLCGDFLAVKPREFYDRVVMNPPFARQADIKHVMHALDFLRPGGRLVAIMSAGGTFRQDRAAIEFRALVTMTGGEIFPLGHGAFRSSGTDVNAVIVALQVPA